MSLENENWGELLLRSTAASAADGFDRIYKVLKAPVMKYALRRVGQPEAAEELTQEVFIKLYRFRSSYRPEHPFSSWFWTLVRNATCDWLRRRDAEVQPVEDDDITFLESLQSGFSDASSPPDAEEEVIRRCFRRSLLRQLKPLTRLQRKVLWLRFVHDLSYQEIARSLGVSLESVKCVIYRARSSLRLELGPELAFT